MRSGILEFTALFFLNKYPLHFHGQFWYIKNEKEKEKRSILPELLGFPFFFFSFPFSPTIPHGSTRLLPPVCITWGITCFHVISQEVLTNLSHGVLSELIGWDHLKCATSKNEIIEWYTIMITYDYDYIWLHMITPKMNYIK